MASYGISPVHPHFGDQVSSWSLTAWPNSAAGRCLWMLSLGCWAAWGFRGYRGKGRGFERAVTWDSTSISKHQLMLFSHIYPFLWMIRPEFGPCHVDPWPFVIVWSQALFRIIFCQDYQDFFPVFPLSTVGTWETWSQSTKPDSFWMLFTDFATTVHHLQEQTLPISTWTFWRSNLAQLITLIGQVFNLNGILLFALFITLTLAVLGPFQCLANPDGSSSMAANPGHPTGAVVWIGILSG